MNTVQNDRLITVPWKKYLKITFESLLAFYLATFCMGMFFTHRGPDWLLPGIFLIVLYLFVIVVCAKRILEKLAMPALMLVIPIAPLIALILVVSLIPLIERLQ